VVPEKGPSNGCGGVVVVVWLWWCDCDVEKGQALLEERYMQGIRQYRNGVQAGTLSFL